MAPNASTHPTVEQQLDSLPADATAERTVPFGALDDALGHPTGKTVARVTVRREQRHVRAMERAVVHTDDGDRYLFSRHGDDEPWAYEAHERADGTRSTRLSRLPEAVRRVALCVLRDVQNL